MNRDPEILEWQSDLRIRTAATMLIAASAIMCHDAVLGAFSRSQIRSRRSIPTMRRAVPLPKPAPKARDKQTQRVGPAASPPQRQSPPQPPDPVIPDPRRNVPANIFTTFDANQKAQAAKSAPICRRCRPLVGNFVQVGPDGTKTKGDFYIQKPGKVRFEYDAPSSDRDHRRRIVGGGTRPQARDPGHLSAVADPATLPAVGSHRSA